MKRWVSARDVDIEVKYFVDVGGGDVCPGDARITDNS